MNIEVIQPKNAHNESNFRLRNTSGQLMSRVLVGYKPCGDGYERVWDESTDKSRYRPSVRLKPGRKQIAARRVVPVNTVKLNEIVGPRPKPVVDAILEGKSEEDVKIAALEAEIRRLMGLLK